MEFQFKQNQISYPILFRMVLAADHVTPATGKTPTVTISKNGAAFAAPAGAVSELANGWYKLAIDADDFDTLGPLLLNATAAASDPAAFDYAVTSGLVTLGPTQTVDIIGNITGSVGSVVSSVTCKCTCKKRCC